MDLITLTTFIFLVFLPISESKVSEQVSLLYTSTTFPELNDHLIPVHRNAIKTNLNQTSLLNMFWAIQKELFFIPTLGKFANLPPPSPKNKQKNRDGVFFGKVVFLKHQNLLKWKPTIIFFLEITKVFW